MIDNDHGSDDAELRELFSRLRQEEQLHAPRFNAESKPTSSIRRTPVRRPLGRTLAGAFLCVVTTLATILYLRHEPRRHPPAPQTGVPVASISEWKPPTDFLLKTPGSEMLRAAPALELRPYLGETPYLKQRTPRVRKRLSP